MTICPYEGTECDFTCPYCHHPFREADAEHVCQQAAACSGACPGIPVASGEKR
jgi:threonyl-tRNA synthetase